MSGGERISEDAGPSGAGIRKPIRVLALCCLVAMIEGYDMQAMSFAAPLLTRDWQLGPGIIGILLAASVAGIVLGNFLLSPLGDYWGRRPSILLALVIAGIATAAGALASDVPILLATRVVAGLGLGLALPNVVALAMETVPHRLRALAVVLVSCGYPLGTALGGLFIGSLGNDAGAAAVFATGGFATLAAAVACAAYLPESPSFGASGIQPRGARGAPVRALFTSNRRAATLLLWGINFANLILVFYFASWLPTILVHRGFETRDAIVAAAAFSGSGMIGGLLLAWLLSRRGRPLLLLGSCYAAILLLSAILSILPLGPIFIVILAATGFAVIGSQLCLMAVVNLIYPAWMRATGSGYATGAGRIGAVLGPLAGATIMSSPNPNSLSFTVAAIPAVVAFVGVLALKSVMSVSQAWPDDESPS